MTIKPRDSDRMARAREAIDRTRDADDRRDQRIAVLEYELLISEMRYEALLKRMVDSLPLYPASILVERAE